MYGIIDIGSNTVRLSCYRVMNRTLIPVFHKKFMVGLSSYVDDDNNLSDAGIKKLIGVLDLFKTIVMCVGLDCLYVVATASLRNVNNHDVAVSRVYDATGFEIEIISGDDEARYDFMGVRYYDNIDCGMVVDIGGGSTEVAPFRDGRMKRSVSLPIGSLNMFSKYVTDIFPTESEEEDIRDRVVRELDKVDIDYEKKIIGVGGSNRACVKLYNDIYDLDMENKVMDFQKIHGLLDSLMDDKYTLLKKVLKITPDRVNTIIPGMIILDEIGHRYNCKSVKVSTGGLREGYIIEKVL